MVNVSRFDVLLISLDPTVGSELQKTRPCLVISPDSMNHSRLNTLIIAPMTSTIRPGFPTRVAVTFQGVEGQVAIDQLRVIDRDRIVKKLGSVTNQVVSKAVLQILQIMFSG